jgi:hypothetical protein
MICLAVWKYLKGSKFEFLQIILSKLAEYYSIIN